MLQPTNKGVITNKENMWVLPTQHPFVKNKNGTQSNVLFSSFEADGKHYAIPTMVGGKILKPVEAFSLAREKGLHYYPNFLTKEEVNAWIQANHGNFSAEGRQIRSK